MFCWKNHSTLSAEKQEKYPAEKYPAGLLLCPAGPRALLGYTTNKHVHVKK